MVRQQGEIQVTMAPGKHRPSRFRWRGRHVRVLGVASINTFGCERRFTLLTPLGRFELGCFMDRDLWYVRRAPGPVGRLVARWQNGPRYPLPAWRRRTVARRTRCPASVGQRGSHADRFAVV